MESDHDIITELLRSNEGIEALVNGGHEFGIMVRGDTGNDIIDFGIVPLDASVESPIPRGYEGFDTGNILVRTVERVLLVTNFGSFGSIDGSKVPDFFTLLEYKCFPSDAQDGIKITIEDEEGVDLKGLQLLKGASISVKIRLKLYTSSLKGFSKRWIVFTWEGRMAKSLTSLNITRFMHGLRTVICIQPSGNPKILNTDAKSFHPKSRAAYFDTTCRTISLADSKIGCISAPSGFQATKQLIQVRPVSPVLKADYETALQSKNWILFISKYKLSFDPLATIEAADHLKRLGRMLWIEELHMAHDAKYFDVYPIKGKFRTRNAPLNPNVPYTKAQSPNALPSNNPLTPVTMTCSVKIKGCSENRPKISIGDVMRLRPLEESLAQLGFQFGLEYKPFPMFEFEGGVLHIQMTTEVITLEFPFPLYIMDLLNFSKRGNLQVIVDMLSEANFQTRCCFRTDGLQFAHEAIQVALNSFALQQTLFPRESISRFEDRRANIASTPLFLSDALNSEQQQAVRSSIYFLQECMRSPTSSSDVEDAVYYPPYIIYGPPGTGKTVTIVHLIRECLQRFNGMHILACAPSDAAADTLLMRLMSDFGPSDLFRLNWWQRSVASTHPSMHKYCEIKDTVFDLPLQLDHKITVTSCTTAGALRGARRPNGATMQFDLVVIDEACQATESETLIPISFCKLGGLVVLAGDPQQLGPAPKSPVYRLSNSTSLMERLLSKELYEKVLPNSDLDSHSDSSSAPRSAFSPHGVMLKKNYRSHAGILELPSKLFYGSHLEEAGPRPIIDSLLSWPGLPNDKGLMLHRPPFPVVFLGVMGQHFHEVDSPSFSNAREVEKVVEVCEGLLGPEGRRLGIEIGHIGVIAAFRSQVLLIRKVLRQRGMGAVNVGEVEDFQGQEVRVAIVTTVLSHRVPALEVDGCLGLFGDHRRFNVAVTRGQAMLVVISHPSVISSDICWRALAEHAYRHGSFQGVITEDLRQMICPLEEHLNDSADEAELLDTVTRVAMLGSGDAASVYPTSVEQYYRRDIEWKVL